jgi:hypothetical protein
MSNTHDKIRNFVRRFGEEKECDGQTYSGDLAIGAGILGSRQFYWGKKYLWFTNRLGRTQPFTLKGDLLSILNSPLFVGPRSFHVNGYDVISWVSCSDWDTPTASVQVFLCHTHQAFITSSDERLIRLICELTMGWAVLPMLTDFLLDYFPAIFTENV